DRVREIAALRQRLRELRQVVPGAWAHRLLRGWIEECNLVGQNVKCPKRWELLRETEEPTVRRCGHCSRDVWYCWSAAEATQPLCPPPWHPIVRALAMDKATPADFGARPYR